MLSHSLEKVLRDLEPSAQSVKIETLEGGISASMFVATLRFPDLPERKYVIRQANPRLLASDPAAAHQEFQLLKALHQAGIAVPEPYNYIPSDQELERPTLVMEWLSGSPCYNSGPIPDFGEQYAAALAALHQRTDLLGQLSWLKPYQADLPPAPNSNQELPMQLEAHQTLARVWPITNRNPTCLLHGDFWPGNLLWHDGQLQAIVDWEDAATGDPLIDLAISRFDLYWIDSPASMERFTDHYLKLNPIDTRHLAAWDLFAALRIARMAVEDLDGWAAFFHDKGHPEFDAAHVRQRFAGFVGQALAAL
jgi:aminoglycoside phosphotransferase (APT) family kinase protein